MACRPIEELDVYLRATALSNRIYKIGEGFPKLAVDTYGTQLVRAIDSVAANLVEGDGRRSDADSVRFFLCSRSSAREVRHWLSVSRDRGKIDAQMACELLEELTEVARMIQGIIKARRIPMTREETSKYHNGLPDDPFCPNDSTT